MSKEKTAMLTENKNYDRITINPAKMSGQPCIRDLRMPVITILAMLGDGMTHEEIIKEFPDIEGEDIKQAVDFAVNVLTQSIGRGKKTA